MLPFILHVVHNAQVNSMALHTYSLLQGSWAQWVKNAPEDTMHLGVKGEDLNK